mmetsp:Transcript_21376/g.65242  ORF Transcript_21376/g.65242 Transcript_21376/m.65242 type:complete len:349 (+) Transcript_21376:126-1172(+)
MSNPEWAPFWIDYKMLKKRLKDMAPDAAAGKQQGAQQQPRGAIASDAKEIAFFRHLMAELNHTVDFYKSAEAEFRIRIWRVHAGLRQITEAGSPRATSPVPFAPGAATVEGGDAEGQAPPCEWQCAMKRRALTSCLRIYKDLLLLENYAVMSYCGFSKILKKHDKVTGYRTRAQYMRRVVNPKPFCKYQGVAKMLHECEDLFRRLAAPVEPGPGGGDAGTAAPNGGSEGLPISDWSDDRRKKFALHEEEHLFIDAIRNINKEASTLARDERAEVEAEAVSASERDITLSDISSITTVSAASLSGPGMNAEISIRDVPSERPRSVSDEQQTTTVKDAGGEPRQKRHRCP